MQINLSIQLDPGELTDTITRLAMLFAPQPALNGSAWPDAPVPTSTPVLPAIPPATEPSSAEEPAALKPKPTTEGPKRVITSARLEFEAFDKLVRSEMKRLSIDGAHMPGHRLWDHDRDNRLPTLSGVLKRYDAPNLVALATKLDMFPPVAINGQSHRKEATP